MIPSDSESRRLKAENCPSALTAGHEENSFNGKQKPDSGGSQNGTQAPDSVAALSHNSVEKKSQGCST